MDWFATRILDWATRFGRQKLPWQVARSPYRVWIAEIMLQQTQVTTVVPFYKRFLKRFPDVHSLALASVDEVLQSWTGLGYYRRARMLHEAALVIQNQYTGELPDSMELLVKLPGIGKSTAGAILASGYGKRGVILDGNAKRVLARFHAIEDPLNKSSVERTLWALADEHTPQHHVAEYTQAIMDMGSTCCRRRNPRCSECPLSENCLALAKSLTAQIPYKTRKSKVTEQTLSFLLVLDANNKVLLTKRPPQGIWASLWSPLEQQQGDTVDSLLQAENISANSVGSRTAMTPFIHLLSHRKLTINCEIVRLKSERHLRTRSAQTAWCAIDDLSQFALSRVTLKLLEHVTELEPLR